jgi:hypothetical protein
LNFRGAVEQRPFLASSASQLESTQPNWLKQSLDQNTGGQPSIVGGLSLAARLDIEILRLRFGGG